MSPCLWVSELVDGARLWILECGWVRVCGYLSGCGARLWVPERVGGSAFVGA